MTHTMKIRFAETVTLADGSQTFESGKVYELPVASAYRWIRRNKAGSVESAPVIRAVTEPAANTADPTAASKTKKTKPSKKKDNSSGEPEPTV